MNIPGLAYLIIVAHGSNMVRDIRDKGSLREVPSQRADVILQDYKSEIY